LFLHKQKYTHKCDKCNLLICEKCSDAHIKHGKSEIYYNFYIKKHKKEIKSKIKSFNVNNSHISDENRKIFYKNQLSFNKFKLLLINDYEIFEKNKTYNNYLIEDYKYIFVNFEPINLEYESLLNHNLFIKLMMISIFLHQTLQFLMHRLNKVFIPIKESIESLIAYYIQMKMGKVL
jgi:hypothetical protein